MRVLLVFFFIEVITQLLKTKALIVWCSNKKKKACNEKLCRWLIICTTTLLTESVENIRGLRHNRRYGWAIGCQTRPPNFYTFLFLFCFIIVANFLLRNANAAFFINNALTK